MVASISARGSAASALRYYDHLQRDDYYSREGEPPGRWAGRGAERLSLDGPVTHAEFDAALSGVDEDVVEGTVEAFGRSPDNPVGGWYGQRKGYRGRFGMYLPPLLEELGLAEVTHDARNNRMRAI